MDRFSLIDVQNLSSETPEILKIKNFLEKFYIRFDNISHPFKIHDSRDISDLINYICDECDGISFTAFTLMTYSEYTHSNYHFSSDSLFALEKQVIYHCLIVSLYTILDFRSRHDYKRLTEILTKYRSKTYASLSDTGYDAKDNSSANRFRTAFDKLDELNTLENFGESQSDYFYKTINIRTEKDSINNTVRCINSFLDEFTYDMIRNTFNQGFNITQKLSLLQKLNLSQKLSPSPSKQNTNNYHREIRRFLDKLHQLDNNFIPTSKLNVLNYLYYYKKERLFHTKSISYIFKYQSIIPPQLYGDLIDIPWFFDATPLFDIVADMSTAKVLEQNIHFALSLFTEACVPIFEYIYFIALCESYNYSLEDMEKSLLAFFNNEEDFQFDNLNQSFIFGNELLTKESICIDYLGNALLENFSIKNYSYSIDTSFSNCRPINWGNSQEIQFEQALSLLKYFKDIIE